MRANFCLQNMNYLRLLAEREDVSRGMRNSGKDTYHDCDRRKELGDTPAIAVGALRSWPQAKENTSARPSAETWHVTSIQSFLSSIFLYDLNLYVAGHCKSVRRVVIA